MTIQMFEVGGCVRDDLLGIKSKDVDFAVVAPSFDAMKAQILSEGMEIFQDKPEFLTIRAAVPKGHPLRARTKDADFVLCRKDGPVFDGRRPESVEPGTLLDDLGRRDFTLNAIARKVDGTLIDPFGGRADLEARRLVFVGDGARRIAEDGLRLLRGLRFAITKDLTIAQPELFESPRAEEQLRAVSTERMRDEMDKMFAHDTLAGLLMLERFPHLRAAVFSRQGLSLSATMKKRKKR